jgi:anti-sigma factor RsiW
MNSAAISHSVAPEKVMAFFDGELFAADAQAVAAHLDACTECAGLASQFRNMSESLSRWSVPQVPSRLDEAVKDYAAKAASKGSSSKPTALIRASTWNWRLWAIGGAGAMAGALLLLFGVMLSITVPSKKVGAPGMHMMIQPSEAGASRYAGPASLKSQMHNSLETPRSGAVAGLFGSATDAEGLSGSAAAPAPMIARAASLSITVKDITVSRASLDAILARNHGYSAELTVESAANAPRSLQASLRIPASGLSAAIGDLKTLGRVEKESQSGEDVTQQHIDLGERLKTARDTEERFRGILQQHTGNVADLLEVEEGIARVRGEIESMEAEQTAIEHRVDFATVDLQLTEEYKAEIISPTASLGARLHHALLAGYRNAANTVVGIVLLLAEYGLSVLIWIVIIPLPMLFLWRRYRKTRSRM